MQRLIAVLGVCLATAAVALGAPPAGAAPGEVGDVAESVPPDRRVYLVTDSVGLGAASYLHEAFPADWQVVVDGEPARFVEQLESTYVRQRLVTNPEWFGDHVVVAGGYNYPYWDPERFDRSIDSMVDTLTDAGVDHVHWVTLREVKPEYISASAWQQIQPYYWYFPTVNRHLRDALARHRNLSLVDWAAVADRSGITYDAIHLNPTGARLYSSIIRQSVDDATTRVADGSITKVHVDSAAGYAAAAINVATISPRTGGFLSAFACDGEPPDVSMHNYARAQIVAHSAIVPLDDEGAFCIYAHTATNLAVDATGLFSNDGFTTVGPTRLFDSRAQPAPAPIAAGDVAVVDLGSLDGAAATADVVVLVATATEADAPGFLRVAPCGSTPDTSNVNYLDATPFPNLVVAEAGNGQICIESHATAHAIVDVFGAIDLPDAMTAAPTVRAHDTRTSGSKVPAGGTITIDLVDAGLPPGISGAVVNVVVDGAEDPGFADVYPCGEGRDGTSTVNVVDARPVSNLTIVRPDDDAKVCVYTSTRAHLVVDVLGDVGPSFHGMTSLRVLDTRG